MEIRKGIAVSPGIAIARGLIIDSKDYRIPRRPIKPSQCAAEIKRVRDAFAEAIRELSELGSDERVVEGKIKDILFAENIASSVVAGSRSGRDAQLMVGQVLSQLLY